MTDAGDSKGGAAAPSDALDHLRFWSLTLAIIVTFAAPALLLAAPLLYRAGLVSLETARGSLSDVAFWLAAAGGVLSLVVVGVHAMRAPKRGVIAGVALSTVALSALGNVYGFQVLRETLPPIHDVQTDWSRPVAFSENALAAREAAGAAPIRDDAMVDTDGVWAGKSVAAAQADAYSLKPLLVDVPPADATVAVEEAAKRMGWSVMRSDPPGGMVEAVHYSTWYGLGSDIAVRVTAQGMGSRIDVRSTSRTSGSDEGANAKRVTNLLDDVAFALRANAQESRAE